MAFFVINKVIVCFIYSTVYYIYDNIKMKKYCGGKNIDNKKYNKRKICLFGFYKSIGNIFCMFLSL